MDFRQTTLADLAARVSDRSLSAQEVVQATLDRIERLNPDLGAFVAVDGEAAMAEAAALDVRLAAGEDVGPLAGVPLAVKDTEDAVGYRTTQGSLAFADAPLATADSPLVERLRAAGCVVVGKTNTPELAWKPDTVNEIFGATHNPWSLARSAGGSSGGAAAAVAAGLVPLATGSDGGGSIRIPCSVNGLSGHKPSLGRVPGGGVQPPGWPLLSTRGPLALRIRDVALALDVVVGPEPTDLDALPLPEASWSRSLAALNPPRRVAWSPTLGYARVDPEVRSVCEQAIERLSGLGTEVIEVDRVFDRDPIDDWLALVGVYCLREMDRFRDDAVWSKVDPGLVAVMEWARAAVSATRIVEAIDSCHRLNLDLIELFHRAPLLLTPTCAGQTPTIGQAGTIAGEQDVNWVRFTYPFNMTRSPAGTVNAGFTADGMPVGLQVVGPQHGDVVVLRAIALLEDTLALNRTAPFGAD